MELTTVQDCIYLIGKIVVSIEGNINNLFKIQGQGEEGSKDIDITKPIVLKGSDIGKLARALESYLDAI